jgi:hypothetical protein
VHKKKGKAGKAASRPQVQNPALIRKGNKGVFDKGAELLFIPGACQVDFFAVSGQQKKIALQLTVHGSSFREK